MKIKLEKKKTAGCCSTRDEHIGREHKTGYNSDRQTFHFRHYVWNFNGMSSCRRRRRLSQNLPPHLVPRRHQVRPHDHRSVFFFFLIFYTLLLGVIVHIYIYITKLTSNAATPLKIGESQDELGAGAGQINPTKAVNPGLIFDLSRTSYISFLCNKNHYAGTALAILTGDSSFNCSAVTPNTGSDGLNYPSMYVPIDLQATAVSAVFHRIVTHVGSGPSTYKAKVKSPMGLSVRVLPEALKFKRANETRSFKVMVKGAVAAEGNVLLKASLEWNDSKHNVRIPILAFRS